MSLRWRTPCDEWDPMTGEYYCPYMSSDGSVDCEYWCCDKPDEDWTPEEDEIEYVEMEYYNG